MRFPDRNYKIHQGLHARAPTIGIDRIGRDGIRFGVGECGHLGRNRVQGLSGHGSNVQRLEGMSRFIDKAGNKFAEPAFATVAV